MHFVTFFDIIVPGRVYTLFFNVYCQRGVPICIKGSLIAWENGDPGPIPHDTVLSDSLPLAVSIPALQLHSDEMVAAQAHTFKHAAMYITPYASYTASPY